MYSKLVAQYATKYKSPKKLFTDTFLLMVWQDDLSTTPLLLREAMFSILPV